MLRVSSQLFEIPLLNYGIYVSGLGGLFLKVQHSSTVQQEVMSGCHGGNLKDSGRTRIWKRETDNEFELLNLVFLYHCEFMSDICRCVKTRCTLIQEMCVKRKKLILHNFVLVAFYIQWGEISIRTLENFYFNVYKYI